MTRDTLTKKGNDKIRQLVGQSSIAQQTMAEAEELATKWGELPLKDRISLRDRIINRYQYLNANELDGIRAHFARCKVCSKKAFDKMLLEAKRIRKQSDTAEQTRNERYCARFPGLVDLVTADGQIKYLVLTSDDLDIADEWQRENGEILIPPERDMIPHELLPASDVISKTADDSGDVYRTLVERLRYVSVLPSDAHYHLCGVYIFFTYLSEQAPYFPYLWFFGLPERGKSRILKVIIILSYRGLYSETLNEAYIFRFADLFGGTLGLDVSEISERAQKKGSHDLLLGRFERGMKVPRVIAPDKGPFRDTVYFTVSGPTVIATNIEISPRDPLRSRCIKIGMPEARDIYQNYSSDDFNDLRAQLLAFRARHLGTDLPDIEKPVPGRLGDLMQPLLSVAALLPPEADEALRSLISELETERQEAESETMAGRVAEALHDLKDEVVYGKLAVEDVRERLNDGVADRWQISPQRLGHELSALGIERKKITGRMYIVWSPDLMERIFERFNLVGNISPISQNGMVEPKNQGELGKDVSPISPTNSDDGADDGGRCGEMEKASPRYKSLELFEIEREGRKGRTSPSEEDSTFDDLRRVTI